ncbi:MAG TPA: sigma-54 dependent transcriptional regulator [Blastocatellia bacterium]|nr:sigma-54 dependent transcriptional regulator [Blastocatellia bacterium]
MFDSPLFGCSEAHVQLLNRIDKVARTDAEILISGPSGVGKELYAQYAHRCSPRSGAAFVPVNCGALPPELIENELFGHVGGAFTGARPQSEGLVATAEGGTLFLDEVDSLAMIAQVKLLRFLQGKEYRRLGETRLRRANVRIIAATNTDLLAAVREGLFREDLFFRLRVIPIEVPPLRERACDIPVLIEEFANRFAETYQLPRASFSPAALEKLACYSWPGNIRELENCINYLTCRQLNRPIQPADLPLLNVEGNGNGNGNSNGHANGHATDAGAELATRPYNEAKRDLVDGFEREYVEDALRRSGGNIAAAARQSGKPRRVFFEIMRKHGIKAEDYML